MKFIDLNNKYWQFAVLFLLAFIWGSSFILMKRGLETYSNYQVAALRIFIAGICLLPLALINIRTLKKRWFDLAVVGFLGNTIPAFLFTTAQLYVSSSMAGILNSLTPLFTLIAGLLFFSYKVAIMQIIGIIIGLFGATMLLSNGSIVWDENVLTYGNLIILATICYGININYVKKYLNDVNGIVIASLSFFITMPFVGIILLFSDFSSCINNPSFASSTIYIIILGVFGSAFAVAMINILIKYTSAVFSSSVTYIMPVFALMWGLLDGEPFTFIQFLALSLILSGVYLVKNKIVKK